MPRALRFGRAFCLGLTLACAVPAAAAAQTARFEESTAEELAKLGIDDNEVESIRYALKRNPGDRGPSILEARAWIRLKSCSGYLVVHMNRSGFVRQSYTEGDCRVEGLKAF